MFSPSSLKEGQATQNQKRPVPPPSGGLNYVAALADMSNRYAVVLDNFLAYPDRVEMRYGATDHVTGFVSPVKGLWVWNGPTSQKLFATCDDGVFDATAAGAVGASVATITDGRTVATTIATGAGHYLLMANAVNDLQQYDGTTWSTVAAFGSLNTNTIYGIETYKQRIFMLQEDTLNLWYLPVNSISGSATSYPLGAIFRLGGKLQSIATWTIDGGAGPDDHLVVVTSNGEVAVFSGTDPSDDTTWSLLGVYYIARPLGQLALYKYGGDVLLLTEGGLWALSTALQTASVDRAGLVSRRIQPLLAEQALTHGTTHGWQVIHHPNVPMLLINVPGVSGGQQLAMHGENKSWSTFSNWPATCWARVGTNLFYGGAATVVHAWTGSADFGANIVATMLGAYSTFGLARDKHVKMMRSTFKSTGSFSYVLGIDNDFANAPSETEIGALVSGAALWGTGLWGEALWGGQTEFRREWRTVPDVDGVYKAVYCQVASLSARPSIQAFEVLYVPGGAF